MRKNASAQHITRKWLAKSFPGVTLRRSRAPDRADFWKASLQDPVASAIAAVENHRHRYFEGRSEAFAAVHVEHHLSEALGL
mmetsp:Transcript_158211/g.279259  ORF Transcript_158211/g.279259 Transcript_158211/m.279259 type:complete len:82 (+) Transcript_158211:203-448(+)